MFLLYLFFRNSDPREIVQTLRSVNIFWLTIALLTNFGALVCRSLRWRIILDRENPPALYPTFLATTIGFMSSAILPVRAGDVVRPALLSRRTHINFARAFGTVITERLLDLISILALFSSFVLIRSEHLAAAGANSRRLMIIRSGGFVAMTVLALAVGFLIFAWFFHAKIRVVHLYLSRFVPRRFRDGWMGFFDSFIRSLDIAREPRALIEVLALTGAIWLFLCSQFFFVMKAMHNPLPFSASFLITGLTIVGLMLPTPGGVGGFHKACQIGLVNFYGFDIDTSIAVAVLFHIVGTAPVIVAGLVLFLKEGFSWRQLLNIGEKPDQM